MTRIPSHIPAPVPAPPPADIASLICGLRAGERAALARAITLVESKRPDHQRSAHQLVQSLLPHTGTARRVGITGAPGGGKSTTIDALGSHLTGLGHKVAVLAVDPSSARTGRSSPAHHTPLAPLTGPRPALIPPSPTRRARPAL